MFGAPGGKRLRGSRWGPRHRRAGACAIPQSRGGRSGRSLDSADGVPYRDLQPWGWSARPGANPGGVMARPAEDRHYPQTAKRANLPASMVNALRLMYAGAIIAVVLGV